MAADEQKTIFVLAGKLASPTVNTWEAIKCVS